MNELEKLREEIDQIDRQMVSLFEKRMEISARVADYKIANGKKVFDKEREQEKMDAVERLAGSEFNRHGIRELFRHIMSMSRKLQYQLLEKSGASGRLPFLAIDDIDRDEIRVVYQGVPGAYSHAAMKQFFGDQVNSFHVNSWRDAMEAIAEGAADYAVLPIENSSAGIVADNYDLLVAFENYIVGEQIIRCEHALLGLPGTSPDQIRRVYSHQQALSQCEEYLNAHRQWEQIPYSNTALAAKKVAQEKDPSQAAVASVYAAREYGLEVLQDHIYYNEQNSTRFLVVTNQRVFRKDAGKISICLEVPHRSGALYDILSHIIYNDLNMTKIESRPIPGRNWEYRFFIDFEGNLAQGAVKNCLRGIREEAVSMKILGNY